MANLSFMRSPSLMIVFVLFVCIFLSSCGTSTTQIATNATATPTLEELTPTPTLIPVPKTTTPPVTYWDGYMGYGYRSARPPEWTMIKQDNTVTTHSPNKDAYFITTTYLGTFDDQAASAKSFLQELFAHEQNYTEITVEPTYQTPDYTWSQTAITVDKQVDGKLVKHKYVALAMSHYTLTAKKDQSFILVYGGEEAKLEEYMFICLNSMINNFGTV